MKEQLIEFETAVLAKEKGFDVETDKFYYHGTFANKEHGSIVDLKYVISHLVSNTTTKAPRQALLQKWLREEELISVEINSYLPENSNCIHWRYSVIQLSPEYELLKKEKGFDIKTECLEKGLQEALKLI